MAREVLSIANLEAWYGESHILHGIELTVREGEVVSRTGHKARGTQNLSRYLTQVSDARIVALNTACLDQ